MTEIRQELLNLIARNNAEQWVPEHRAFQQLLDLQGDRLIPGLIECLGDNDAEVRRLAVNLLDEAGPAATPALPLMIQMVGDRDRLVRVAAAHSLEKFGPQAAEAVPLLLPWLRDENEYIRLLAAVTMIRLDPTKADQLMPIIQAATASNNPMMQGLAEEFLNGR
jgi:HEAT repeat protein